MSNANHLRIAALVHANARRTRVIDASCGELAVLKDERAALLARRVAKFEQIDDESRAIVGYEERVARMTDSSESFSIDDFNQSVCYIGILTERRRGMVADLEQLDDKISGVEQAIARIQHDIAINTQRIDRCSKRIGAILRAIDLVRDDAQDDENEEMATSRFIWARAAKGNGE
ncbi:hypothetical protein [Burkholderia cepacia]|uniref:hypothetical protein n=1 Tax=Burkholderia cepacia TaxID=292 RepID=UPI00158ED859|nr:hypothetical protein [Burkholderia cepacia]